MIMIKMMIKGKLLDNYYFMNGHHIVSYPLSLTFKRCTKLPGGLWDGLEFHIYIYINSKDNE